MQIPIRVACIAAALALAPPAGAATIVSIDFESLADGEVVAGQFTAQGVTIGNAVALSAGISLNEIDFPPSSGTDVISGLGAGPIALDFSQPADRVRLQLTTFNDAVVRYYDTLNAVLGQTLVTPNLGGHTLVSFDPPSPQVARVTIGSLASDDAFFLTVDDVEVTFERDPAAVPEPSAFLTLACGLLAVGGSLRRRA